LEYEAVVDLGILKQEGIAVGRTFATIRNYKVDGNKEMIAIGFMNMVGSTTSCYVTTGWKTPRKPCKLVNDINPFKL